MGLAKVADGIDQNVLDAVSRRTPDARNVRILSVQSKFLDGTLYTVGFDGSPDPESSRVPSYVNRVYVHGRAIEVFGHDEALLNIVGATHAKSAMTTFGDTKIVSGIIATIMTLVVVAIVAVGLFKGSGISVPEPIATAWLIVVGFYFGKLGDSR